MYICIFFRYRAIDAWKRCTRILIAETRKNDIMVEIMNASKLKAHFQDNPEDLQVLRDNKQSKGLRNMPHLKNVQDYMMSDNLRKVSKTIRKKNVKKSSKTFDKQGEASKKFIPKAQKKHLRHKKDPLRSMEFSGFKSL